MAGRYRGTPYDKPPVTIRPERTSYVKPHLLGLSSETRRILEELERMNTPVRDAKRIPLNPPLTHPNDTGETSTLSKPGPPKLGLLTPTRAQILPRLSLIGRQRVENGVSSSNYSVNSWNNSMLSKSPEKEKFSMGGGKMRSASTYTGRSTFSARRPDLDDTNVAEEFIQSEKDTIEPSPFTFSKPRVLHPSSDPPSAGTSNKKLIIPSTKKPADTESSTQASEKRKISPAAHQPIAKRDAPTATMKNWFCSVCYASNPETTTACACCTTLKSGVATKESSLTDSFKPNVPSTTSSSFSFGFGGTAVVSTSFAIVDKKDGTNGQNLPSVQCDFDEYRKGPKWRCSFCFFNNHSAEPTCLQCQKKKEDSAKNESSKELKKLNENTETPKTTVAASNVASIAPTTTVTNKDTGGPKWSCNCCFISNASDSSTCAACGSAKPGPPKPAEAAKKWTCEVCCVPNESTIEQCVCCAAAKPGSAKPADSKSSAFGSSIFKPTGLATPSGFSFGFGTNSTVPPSNAQFTPTTKPNESTVDNSPLVGSGGKKSVRFAEPLTTAADAVVTPTSPMQTTPMTEAQPFITSTTTATASEAQKKDEKWSSPFPPLSIASTTTAPSSTSFLGAPPSFTLPALSGGAATVFGDQKDSKFFKFGQGSTSGTTEPEKAGADSTTETTSAIAVSSAAPTILFGTAGGVGTSVSSLFATSTPAQKTAPMFGSNTTAIKPAESAFPSIPPSFKFGGTAATTSFSTATTASVSTAPSVPSFTFGSGLSTATSTAPSFPSFAPVSTVTTTSAATLPSFGSFTSSTTADSTMKSMSLFGASASVPSFPQTSTSGTNLFGSSATSTAGTAISSAPSTFTFGNSGTAKPIFGQSNSSGTASAAPAFNFGAPPNVTEAKPTGLFGSSASGTKLFGGDATAPAAPAFGGFGSASSLSTGTPNSSSTNLFGSGSSSNLLPSSGSGTNLFGSSTPAVPSTNSSGNLFGSASSMGTGSGMFQFGGVSAAPVPPSFSFGAPPSSGTAPSMLSTAVPNNFAFGSTTSQPASQPAQFNMQSSGFNFGAAAAAPTAEVFQFGGNSQQQSGNLFSVTSSNTSASAASRKLLHAKRKTMGSRK